VSPGIRTKRVTDPQNPNYKGLDGSHLGTFDRPLTPDASFNTFFKNMDLDGDGKISAQEFIAALDTDGDGQVSIEEMSAAMHRATEQTAPAPRSARDDEIEKLKKEIRQLKETQRRYAGGESSSGRRPSARNVSRRPSARSGADDYRVSAGGLAPVIAGASARSGMRSARSGLGALSARSGRSAPRGMESSRSRTAARARQAEIDMVRSLP
jgi:hypothetical protein